MGFIFRMMGNVADTAVVRSKRNRNPYGKYDPAVYV